MIQPLGKPVVPEVIMMMNGWLPSTSIPILRRCGTDRLFVRRSLRYESPSDEQYSLGFQAVEYQIGSIRCLVSFFEDKCFWLKEAEHRLRLLTAPMVIKRNCRNAYFCQSKDDLQVLCAIAAGERDAVARTDTLL